jgi:hypothetical protein
MQAHLGEYVGTMPCDGVVAGVSRGVVFADALPSNARGVSKEPIEAEG